MGIWPKASEGDYGHFKMRDEAAEGGVSPSLWENKACIWDWDVPTVTKSKEDAWRTNVDKVTGNYPSG